VSQQLALTYGGRSYVRPDGKTAATQLLTWLRQRGIFKKGDVVVLSAGQQPGIEGGTDTIKVRVLE
jgi:pyruvate kinase